MINEESIRNWRKNEWDLQSCEKCQHFRVLLKRGVIRSIKDRIFFNFKYRTLFRSNNYLGIISESAWKKNGDQFGVGIISGSIWGSFRNWGSLRGRDHFGGCTHPHTDRKLNCHRLTLRELKRSRSKQNTSMLYGLSTQLNKTECKAGTTAKGWFI